MTLLWFAGLMNVTEEVTIHRPNVSTLLSSAFSRGDRNVATRGPFKRLLILTKCNRVSENKLSSLRFEGAWAELTKVATQPINIKNVES